ncbi:MULTISPECIES: ABC transporter permease [Chelativorans]|jgi:ABC-type nitrate/sulfonate/bicarbonate transport system permease component|uniref:Binding-protein-dependent transport systems inner membrane component n=1 Tax=Chelativorans sp. (strain BNC1) TaxID=266779 RepID=Q11CG5_CHESB|nr:MULTISPECIES: ABC transporter permease subunit [Chelativorans]
MLALANAAKGFLPLVIAIGVWQYAGDKESALFPPPATWWPAIADLIAADTFFPALNATLSLIGLSLAAASLVGFVLGLVIGTLPGFRHWTSLVLEYLRALPPPVIIPLAVLLLGYTMTMKVSVIAFAAFWPVMLNTIAGVSQIHNLTFDVARSLRMTWFETLSKVVLPATIPSLLLGIRIALPQSVVVTLVVEMFTGESGIGSLMIAAQRNFNAAEVFGLLAVMGLFGYGLTAAFSGLERAILRRWPLSASAS